MGVCVFWVWALNQPAELIPAGEAKDAARHYARSHKILVHSVYVIGEDMPVRFKPELSMAAVGR